MLLPLVLAFAASAAASAASVRPHVMKEAGRYNCLAYNDSRGLICDIVAEDAAEVIAGLPLAPQAVANLSLVIQSGGPAFSLPVEALMRQGPQLESLFVHSYRPFNLSECSLQPLAGSLRSLQLRGVREIGDPFCATARRLRTLKLTAASDDGLCCSPQPTIDRARASLVELYIGTPVDCSLAGFQVDGLPRLESVVLRSFKDGFGGGEEGGGGGGRLIVQEDNLAGLRFSNLPSLRTLTLPLNRKIVKCNGHVFGPGAFVNLTSLETVHIGGMFVMPNPGSGHCSLLAPGAFQTGSVGIRSVSISAGFLTQIRIDLAGNADLLRCDNCTRQTLAIGEAAMFAYTSPAMCRLVLPHNLTLNVTHLRVARCQVGAIDVGVMRNWPRLRTLLIETEDEAPDEGAGGRQKLLVSRLHLGDLLGYLSENPALRHATLFAEECVCPDAPTAADQGVRSGDARKISIGCGNLEPGPFATLSAVLRACAQFAAFPAQVGSLLGAFAGQCVLLRETEVSCVVARNFNQSEPVPYRLSQLDCLLDTEVSVLTRQFLSAAENLRTLALSGSYLSRLRREGLYAIEEGAFASARSLETLALRNNKLGFITARTFDGLTRLRQLDLSSNFFLSCLDRHALRPVRDSLERLHITVMNPAQLPDLISQTGLPRLASLSVEVSSGPLGFARQQPPVDIPTGSLAGLPSLQELALAFDDYRRPRRVVMRTGSVARLPSLQSLAVRLDNEASRLTLETGAFANLSGDLRYLSLQSLLPPVPASVWRELLAGPRDAWDRQEAVLGFCPTAEPLGPASVTLLGDLAPTQRFNTSVLTLSVDSERRPLTGDDLERLGRLFPALRQLNLQSCLSLANASHPARLLSGLMAAAGQLERLHAIPAECAPAATAASSSTSRYLARPNNGTTRPRLLLTLDCSGEAGVCRNAAEAAAAAASAWGFFGCGRGVVVAVLAAAASLMLPTLVSC